MKHSPIEEATFNKPELEVLSKSFRDLMTEISDPHKLSDDQRDRYEEEKKDLTNLYDPENKEEALEFLLEVRNLAEKLSDLAKKNPPMILALEAIHDNANSEKHPHNPIEFLLLYMVYANNEFGFDQDVTEEAIFRVASFDMAAKEAEEILTFYDPWKQFFNKYFDFLKKEELADMEIGEPSYKQ